MSAGTDATPPESREHYNFVLVSHSFQDPFPLRDPTTLGQSPRCHFRLHGEGVDGVHCLIFRRGDDWMIRNLRSATGVLLNGASIDEAPLRPSDTIRIGPHIFRLIPASELKSPSDGPALDPVSPPVLQRSLELDRKATRLTEIGKQLAAQQRRLQSQRERIRESTFRVRDQLQRQHEALETQRKRFHEMQCRWQERADTERAQLAGERERWSKMRQEVHRQLDAYVQQQRSDSAREQTSRDRRRRLLAANRKKLAVQKRAIAADRSALREEQRRLREARALTAKESQRLRERTQEEFERLECARQDAVELRHNAEEKVQECERQRCTFESEAAQRRRELEAVEERVRRRREELSAAEERCQQLQLTIIHQQRAVEALANQLRRTRSGDVEKLDEEVARLGAKEEELERRESDLQIASKQIRSKEASLVRQLEEVEELVRVLECLCNKTEQVFTSIADAGTGAAEGRQARTAIAEELSRTTEQLDQSLAQKRTLEHRQVSLEVELTTLHAAMRQHEAWKARMLGQRHAWEEEKRRLEARLSGEDSVRNEQSEGGSPSSTLSDDERSRYEQRIGELTQQVENLANVLLEPDTVSTPHDRIPANAA